MFSLTMDGGLHRWEAMNMTNTQRKKWLSQMTERAKRQKEAREKASAKAGPSTGPSRL